MFAKILKLNILSNIFDTVAQIVDSVFRNFENILYTVHFDTYMI